MAGRGLRGSFLEEIINVSNETYREKKLALIQKVPTPITPITIDKKSRHITLAYFDQKSTVDYLGVVQGVPICFDAKECNSDNFSLQNIHAHQYEFMRDFEAQDGIAFIIVYYIKKDKKYYIPFKDVEKFYLRAQNGGIKHFKFEEIDQRYEIRSHKGVPVHYLEQISFDMEQRVDTEK